MKFAQKVRIFLKFLTLKGILPVSVSVHHFTADFFAYSYCVYVCKNFFAFLFLCLFDFSGTTRILILVYFYRIYCSLTEALGLSVSIVLQLQYYQLNNCTSSIYLIVFVEVVRLFTKLIVFVEAISTDYA